MLFSETAINSTLTEFSVHQRQLIKSRFDEFYNTGSRNRVSWNRFSSAISDLPEDPRLSIRDREIVLARRRYYLTLRSSQGREKPSSEDIRDGNYTISKATLHRIYQSPSGLNGFDEHDIAALRDFLLVHEYLTEAELEFDDPVVGIAHNLNGAIARLKNKITPVPLFKELYLSYHRIGKAIIRSDLKFIAQQENSLLAVSKTDNRFVPSGEAQIKQIMDGKIKPPQKFLTTGWVPTNSSPALFFLGLQQDTNQVVIEPLNVIAFKGNEALNLSLESSNSFVCEHGAFQVSPKKTVKEYVPSDYDATFDYFEENLYTREVKPNNFYAGQQKRRYMQPISKNSTGQEFYQYIRDLLSTDELIYNLDKVTSLIQDGVDTKYVDPDTGQDVLILFAGGFCGLWPGLVEAMIERDDTHYITVDNDRKDACYYASWHEYHDDVPEIRNKLREKKIEQIQRDNIDVEKHYQLGRKHHPDLQP